MAGFRAHIATSSLLGFAYAGGAHVLFHTPLSSTLLAGGLCAVSGMLPDMDSRSAVPKRESIAFASAVIPMMMIHHLQRAGCDTETMVLVGAILYLLIRFVGGHLLSRFTTHRGMFHSIPAALCFGELVFLLSSGTLGIRWFKAGAVILGYLSHLVLDEFHSIDLGKGRVRLRRSLGTGMKMFNRNIPATAFAYIALILLTLTVMQEPRLIENVDALREAAGVQLDAAVDGAASRSAETPRESSHVEFYAPDEIVPISRESP